MEINGDAAVLRLHLCQLSQSLTWKRTGLPGITYIRDNDARYGHQGRSYYQTRVPVYDLQARGISLIVLLLQPLYTLR